MIAIQIPRLLLTAMSRTRLPLPDLNALPNGSYRMTSGSQSLGFSLFEPFARGASELSVTMLESLAAERRR